MTGLGAKLGSRKFLSMLGIVFTDLGAVLSGHTDTGTLGALALATVAVMMYIAGESKVDAASATPSPAPTPVVITPAVPAPAAPPSPSAAPAVVL